ncbi:SDR family NAD(P)-dependent oxidoreductase [Bradyrhizobium sp. STM 3809]|uniref:SDR family NAD(P)-dependent oxidoreductase n=1 Tax=Bradyrhizobium sp. STM 3809 TaxID=551936 RepID=UPI000240885A|nr:SDR family NAD(P)-dependent oxidoreductase [Bradyrhizobium sp. STM 3809]CCE00135.1 putative Short-chain dehydrogenase/reductase family protein [Bradyrhizobium sp. STM 3809]
MSQNKPVALIIGMGPGLSAALAERFAAGGCAVVGFARRPENSADLVRALAAKGLHLEMRAADAGDAAGLAQAIAQVEAEIGPVEVLIFNAYRATYAVPSSVPVEELVADFRVNVAGALAAVQAVLPGMRARKRGTILLTGGGLALDPTGWLQAASLAVGKAGIRNLAASLHKELAGEGIRVATVTIKGQIAAGTAFAPELIAEQYWAQHAAQQAGPAEVVYGGRP